MNQPQKVYLDQQMTEPEALEGLGGSVAIFSRRSPDKDSANEDSAAVIATGPDRGVLVVADGMGGGAAGEQASKIAAEAIRAEVRRAADLGHPTRVGVLNGIESANQAILDLGVGAGSTVIVLEVDGAIVRPYHVGDSSILVVGQRGKIKLETVAHSPVGLAIEAGVLDHDDAMQHEERHLVTNFLGTPAMRMEIGSPITLSRFDTVLLASDGLLDNLRVSEAVEATRKGPLPQAVARLVNQATQRMTSPHEGEPSKADDLTIIAFRRQAEAG